jgi:Cu2+-exporting ATPase
LLSKDASEIVIDATASCFHCGMPVPAGAVHRVQVQGRWHPVCCTGCEAVATAILEQSGEAYYRLRSARPPQPAARQGDADLEVYDDPEVQRGFACGCGTAREAVFLLEGIRCSACAWVIERALAGIPGVLAARVNYASQRATVRWDPERAEPSQILGAVARVGYSARPYDPRLAETARSSERRDLLWRLFVAGFGMMQVMMYALPSYLSGDGEMSADIAQLMRWASLILTLPVVLYSAGPFFRGALRDLRARRPGMDVPIALGVFIGFAASVANTMRGAGEVYFDSATMFVFLLLLGRFLEFLSRARAAQALQHLGRLIPESAHRLRDFPRSLETERVPASRLRPGDFVLVKPGETVPADGVVASGTGPVSEALLTGEASPVSKNVGAALVGGSANLASPLVLEVRATGADTVLSSISRLIERAAEAKPRLVELAERAASWFIFMVLALAAAAGAIWAYADPSRSVGVVIAVLVATCPCALSLATPIAMTVAANALSRSGVIVTRSGVLEALARITDVVFDKTGTLTRGELQVADLQVHGAVPPERCLAIAAALEAASEHPIAKAIAAAARTERLGQVRDLRNVPGEGVEGWIEDRRYRIGRFAFASEPSGTQHWEDTQGTVWLADSGGPLASFRLWDEPRPEARDAVAALERLGVTVHLLSGDARAPTEEMALGAGIRSVRAEAAPEDKRRYVARLQEQGRRVAMIGDGINDAPVLAQADVSLAMGSGARLAQTRAGAVILSQDLRQVPQGIALARRALGVVRENVLWAFGYNLVVLPLAVSGVLTPWAAAIGMSASSLLVIANALRLQRAAPAGMRG